MSYHPSHNSPPSPSYGPGTPGAPTAPCHEGRRGPLSRPWVPCNVNLSQAVGSCQNPITPRNSLDQGLQKISTSVFLNGTPVWSYSGHKWGRAPFLFSFLFSFLLFVNEKKAKAKGKAKEERVILMAARCFCYM